MENKDRQEEEVSPSQYKVVKNKYFNVRYLYLDDNTRIRYGFSLGCLGTAYTLQRKKCFWKTVAFTYPQTMPNRTLKGLIVYLKWYEQSEKEEKSKTLF